jgi:3-deoxy-D-manno-octulosonic acid kinase
MTPKYLRQGKRHILYDAARADHVGADFFDPSVWQRQGLLMGTAQGRGAAAFVQGPGGAFVLRHYRRGGLPARISDDCYVWTGLGRSRAWREWHLLCTLRSHGLPVPEPVAVQVERSGLCYRADIVTARIVGESLAERLAREPLPAGQWAAIGACIRRFHRLGVCHADLNAHNILLDGASTVHLVDFDRGRFRAAGGWREANLERLQRSLRKLASLDVRFAYHEQDFEALRDGYRAD